MNYSVVEAFSLETSQGMVTLPFGKVLELSKVQALRLIGKVELLPLPNGGRNLSHYCAHGDCWCSAKSPHADFPAECLRINCEYYQPKENI
jgi:hypothetical protein